MLLFQSDFTLLNTEIAKLQSEIDKNYTNMKGEVKEGGLPFLIEFFGSTTTTKKKQRIG